MRKEIIETGKTVDAAIEAACAKLGYDREQCEFEIIDLPKKTFLGLKTVPAKVKVFIDLPDEKPAPRQERPRLEQPVPKAQPTRPEQKKTQPAPPVQKPVKREEPKRQEPVREAAPEMEEPLEAEPRILVTEGFTEKETTAMAYIEGILKEFGLTAQLQLSREGNGICVDINGEGLGTIIGRRGETLDAIQYLTGLVGNRLEGDYLRVTVDCGDYRTKRKDTLEALAKKLAAQVLKTNTSKTLEPMNPFERRVIHATVSRIEGVSSSSIGEEPNRRVVITTPTARRPASRGAGGRDRGERGERDGDRRRRGSGSSGGRDRGERSGRDRGGDRGERRPPRPSNRPPAPTNQMGPPKETPETAALGNAPIGKLDLE